MIDYKHKVTASFLMSIYHIVVYGSFLRWDIRWLDAPAIFVLDMVMVCGWCCYFPRKGLLSNMVCLKK